jgi:hypothetical protein
VTATRCKEDGNDNTYERDSSLSSFKKVFSNNSRKDYDGSSLYSLVVPYSLYGMNNHSIVKAVLAYSLNDLWRRSFQTTTEEASHDNLKSPRALRPALTLVTYSI